jgi:hypothetical protein
MVTVLRKRPQPGPRTELGRGARRWLWTVTLLDAMQAAWMISLGDWLDSASRVTAVITLGGHHRAVLALAVIGFVMLAGLALCTDAFTSAGRAHRVAIAVAGVVSVVALAGAVSVVIVVVTFGLLGGLLFGRWIAHLLALTLF